MKHGVQALLRLAIGGIPPESAPAPPPTVTSITPNTGENTGTVQITDLAGGNFQTGATVRLTKSGETDINGTSVVVVSSSKITCNFDLTGVVTGLWNVKVTNPDLQSGTLTNGFTVTGTPPTGYYVATSGDDENPGTFEAPWRHIAYAVGGSSGVGPGDTVYVRGGLYDEVIDFLISGTSGNLITLRNYPGETPVIKDTANTRSWKCQIFDRSYLRLYGLTWSGSGGSGFRGGGIYIRADNAAVTQITIENCRFEYQTYLTNGDAKHTVYVVATVGYAISYFRGIDNEFYQCDTVWQDGSHASDNMTIIGDVSYAVYDGNYLELCTGLGLNVIGTAGGQPHHVIIKNNVALNCGTRRTTSAAQIYNDAAGSYIIIENNITGNGAIGIALAAERGGLSHGRYAIVRHNISFNNWMNYVFGGGWNDACSTVSSPHDIVAVHNTAYLDENWALAKSIKFYCTEDLLLLNNIWAEANSVNIYMYSVAATGDTSDWKSDQNDHYPSGGGTTWWTWDGTYTSFAAFQSGTGEEGNGFSSNPLFVNPGAENFALQSGSPCRNAAGPLTTCNGGGSGTTVTVYDARPFSDGYGLQDGDMIRIGGGVAVEVTGVNYTAKTLTIASSRTWDDGDRVDYDYQGTAPDLGALEYSE